MNKRFMGLLLLALPILLITGCRDSAQASPTPAAQLMLTVQPDPPSVGAAELLVTVRDLAGAPVVGASVDVRGDMNHAGMQPVLREDVLTDANGEARIPFEWTMGGDWYLVVTATLPDSTVVEQRFEGFQVGG